MWSSAYGHSSRVFDVAFSPDGASIVSASEDTTARVWRCAGGAQTSLLSGHTAEVLRASWRSDGAVVATGAPLACSSTCLMPHACGGRSSPPSLLSSNSKPNPLPMVILIG